jgi:hypothetical protein
VRQYPDTAAREVAELANWSKSEFLANTSHEIRCVPGLSLSSFFGILTNIRSVRTPMKEQARCSVNVHSSPGSHVASQFGDRRPWAKTYLCWNAVISSCTLDRQEGGCKTEEHT